MASKLAALQATLQQDILTGKTQSLPLLSVPKGATPEKRLFVYQYAYTTRLVGILSEDFDTTWTFLGDQTFYDLAREFIQTHPSNTPNARWFSHRFPDFLATGEKTKDIPAISEIAYMERALSDAFDAENAAVATRDDLARVAESNIEHAKFILHPSVTLLRQKTNSYDVFSALRKEETPAALKDEEEPQWLLVWRNDLMCRHMELDREQGALLDLVQQGYGFSQLCEVSATIGDPDTAAYRMAGYLGSWIENALITEIQPG